MIDTYYSLRNSASLTVGKPFWSSMQGERAPT